mmetsp:Transcript_2549/g.3347  ORF Transcript_2549/g.3347 Transcript_2549/m.3347 type:complete len:313 (+) Transcript_2549:1717-2655(+)
MTSVGKGTNGAEPGPLVMPMDGLIVIALSAAVDTVKVTDCQITIGTRERVPVVAVAVSTRTLERVAIGVLVAVRKQDEDSARRTGPWIVKSVTAGNAPIVKLIRRLTRTRVLIVSKIGVMVTHLVIDRNHVTVTVARGHRMCHVMRHCQTIYMIIMVSTAPPLNNDNRRSNEMIAMIASILVVPNPPPMMMIVPHRDGRMTTIVGEMMMAIVEVSAPHGMTMLVILVVGGILILMIEKNITMTRTTAVAQNTNPLPRIVKCSDMKVQRHAMMIHDHDQEDGVMIRVLVMTVIPMVNRHHSLPEVVVVVEVRI